MVVILKRKAMFDRTGLIIAVATFIFSVILFSSQNHDIPGSIFAGLIAAGMFWIAYAILRWFYLATR